MTTTMQVCGSHSLGSAMLTTVRANADDMYKEVSPGSNAAYSCVANVRNTDTPTKIMVKFLRKVPQERKRGSSLDTLT